MPVNNYCIHLHGIEPVLMKRLILHFFQVMWTRLKYLLDWVSWAIPFYDEIHLVMLIWMIVMGPSVRFITAWRHSLR